MLRVRYALAGLALLAALAAGVAYETRDPGRTEVPAIELLADQASELESTERAGPAQKRRKESTGRRTRSGRGAAPVPAQAPARAGDDDDDDD
jgi:hypothetical protein